MLARVGIGCRSLSRLAPRVAPRSFDFDAAQLPLTAPPRRPSGVTHRRLKFVKNDKQKQQDPLKHEIAQQQSRIERSRLVAAELRTSPEPLTLGAYFAQDGVSKNVYHYTRLIRLQHHHGHVDACLQTFEAMKLDGRVPNSRTYSAILSALCIPTHFSMAMTSLDKQQQTPWYEAACRIWDEAMRLPAASKCPAVYSAMLKVLAAYGDSARARQLLVHMEKRDIALSSVALERAVRACTRDRKFHLALETFQEYRHLVGIPSLHLYTRMVQVTGRLHRTADAVLLFEELIEVGYKPSLVQYNSIIHAASLSPPNRHYVGPLFERMLQDDSCEPDARTLTIVMVGCAKSGDVDVALQVLRLVPSMEIEPPTLHDLFCQFMTCLSTANREHPDPLLLQKSSPDGKLLSVEERCRLAEETFQLMQTKYDLPVLNKTLNSLLFVYTSGKKMTPALSVFDLFAEHNLEPDLDTYKALLSPYVRAVVAPDRADLDRLRQRKSWQPSDPIQYDLRCWASRVAPRRVGIEALEFVLQPRLSP